MVVTLFTMTTRLNSILQILHARNKDLQAFYQLAYIINTTFAVAPSIQYDLQHAIDTETIRRGKKIGLFSLDSWIAIFTITLVRTLNRTERFTETIIDRGYVLSEGMSVISERSANIKDIFLTGLFMIPGIIIWVYTM